MHHLSLRPILWSLGLVLFASPMSLVRADDPPAKSAPKDAAKRLPGLRAEDAEIVAKINQRIAEKWAENKLTPSARATDYEFIRRVTIDLVGRIAKPDEITAFFKEPEFTRRSHLIERLLKSDEYARNWANIWTVWLMTRNGETDRTRSIYHEQMHRWLYDMYNKETVSHKEMVIELLTATGKTNENGAVNYILAHLGEPTPREKASQEGPYSMVPVTSRTTRLFLGMQIQCSQCHPHPFNKEWTQRHFWGINGFFRQVDRKGMPAMRNNMEATVLELVDKPEVNTEGLVIYEQRSGLMLSTRPVFLAKDSRPISPDAPRRRELARLITESEYFPKAYVNRMWGHFFGRGFTSPIDDFTPENEPSHPELLDDLGIAFKNYGYDPRRLMRWICNSDAYNLSSAANKTNAKSDAEPFFSRMLLKSMSPEELFESLMLASQAERFMKPEEVRDLRRRWMRNLTSNFGDDEGNEITYNGTVVQALLIMNGNDLNRVIGARDQGTVALAVMLAKKSPTNIIKSLYLSCLNRPPTAKETARIMEIYKNAPVRSTDGLSFWQDVQWALLNCNEFILNH